MDRKLMHAVTEYDRKQSTRKGYNPYALPQYFAAVNDALADIAAGTSPRAALLGALLIGVAVVIGIVLLQIGDRNDNGPVSAPKSSTTV